MRPTSGTICLSRAWSRGATQRQGSYHYYRNGCLPGLLRPDLQPRNDRRGWIPDNPAPGGDFRNDGKGATGVRNDCFPGFHFVSPTPRYMSPSLGAALSPRVTVSPLLRVKRLLFPENPLRHHGSGFRFRVSNHESRVTNHGPSPSVSQGAVSWRGRYVP